MVRSDRRKGADAKRKLFERPPLFGRVKTEVDRSIDKLIGRDFKDADLVIVPPDLTTTDPSLVYELSKGQFGLDGMFVEFDPKRELAVFDAPYADDGFRRALHGFGWLRDLAAADDAAARNEAQQLVFGWIERFKRVDGVPYEPLVVARRIVAFLSNAPLLTAGLVERRRRRFVQALCQQTAVAHRQLSEAGQGLDRLSVLAALSLAGLCLSRHAEMLAEVAPLLDDELDHQILDDGGHLSRDPGALMRLLFELIPIRQIYVKRQQEVPEGLSLAIDRMMPMLRFFRMGDSSLARFNGQSATPTDALATLLAHDERKRPFKPHAEQSGYARLEDGPAVVLADIGAAPPLAMAGHAHAGCLSFELSVRHFALVVNAGAFTGEDETWRRFSRSTAAHSTLTIDDRSQGAFRPDGRLDGPHDVFVEHAGERLSRARHRAYEPLFGVAHHRTLMLEYDGLRLAGIDRLEGRMTKRGLGFAIRFHLHPFIDIGPGDGESLFLQLPDGEVWRFAAKGAAVTVDEGIYMAYRRGLEPAHQITLSGEAVGGLEVDWLFEQVKPRPPVA